MRDEENTGGTEPGIPLTPAVAGTLAFLVVQNLTWKKCLAELIDNAFDAGSPNVHIQFGPKGDFLRVVDQGVGMSDVREAIRLGQHTEHPSTRLGRSGIGMKDAALHIGGSASRLTIESICKRRRQYIEVDWGLMAERGVWELPASAYRERPAGLEERGTEILIQPCKRRIPEGQQWADLERELGYLFAPGLEAGLQITIQSKVAGREPMILHPPKAPLLTDPVDQVIAVGGRMARVTAGLLKEGETTRWTGMSYASGHRIIKEAGIQGCNGMDYSRLVGRAMLDRQWKFTKNKDEFAEDAEELYAAVFAVIRPLLEKSAERARTMSYFDMQSAAQTKLAALLGSALAGAPNAKAKRGKGAGGTGTVRPKGTERRHRRAARSQTGESFLMQPGIEVKIILADLEGDGIGKADYDRHLNVVHVQLKRDHPVVADAIESKRDGYLALVAFGCLFDLGREGTDPGQILLPGLDGRSFAEEVGRLFARGVTVDGVTVDGVTA